jgi:hypothetical protein
MQKSLVIVSEYYMKNLFFNFLTEVKKVLYSDDGDFNGDIEVKYGG